MFRPRKLRYKRFVFARWGQNTPKSVCVYVAECRTGRLLGAQFVCGEGAGKRIDVLATALWTNMTVEAVGGMDLSYASPFSPVWDPVLLAAGKAASRI